MRTVTFLSKTQYQQQECGHSVSLKNVYSERSIATVKRKNWYPTEYSRVCCDHSVTGELEHLINAIV